MNVAYTVTFVSNTNSAQEGHRLKCTRKHGVREWEVSNSLNVHKCTGPCLQQCFLGQVKKCVLLVIICPSKSST